MNKLFKAKQHYREAIETLEKALEVAQEGLGSNDPVTQRVQELLDGARSRFDTLHSYSMQFD